MAGRTRSLGTRATINLSKEILNFKGEANAAVAEVRRVRSDDVYSVPGALGRVQTITDDHPIRNDKEVASVNHFDKKSLPPTYASLKDPVDVGLSRKFQEDRNLVAAMKSWSSVPEVPFLKDNIQAYYKKRWLKDSAEIKGGICKMKEAKSVETVKFPDFLPKNMVELPSSKSSIDFNLNENLRYSKSTMASNDPDIVKDPVHITFGRDARKNKLMQTALFSKEAALNPIKEVVEENIEPVFKQTTLDKIIEERRKVEIRKLRPYNIKMHNNLLDNSKSNEQEKVVPEFMISQVNEKQAKQPTDLNKNSVFISEKQLELASEESQLEDETKLTDIKLMEKIKDAANSDLENIFLKFKPPIFNFKEYLNQPESGNGLRYNVMLTPKRGFCSLSHLTGNFTLFGKQKTTVYLQKIENHTNDNQDPCIPKSLPPMCVPDCVKPKAKAVTCEIKKQPVWTNCDKMCLPCCDLVAANVDCKEHSFLRNTCKRETYRIPAYSECDKNYVTPTRMKECCYNERVCHTDDLEREIKPLLPIRRRQEQILGMLPSTAASCDNGRSFSTYAAFNGKQFSTYAACNGRKFSTSAASNNKNFSTYAACNGRKFSTSAVVHQEGKEEAECKLANQKLPCVKSTELSGKEMDKRKSEGKKVCEKFCMPCCAPARDPPDCFYPYVKPPCKKMRPPRPSYSECKSDFPMKPVVPCECVRPRESTCKNTKNDENAC